jgi:hypothetical protein
VGTSGDDVWQGTSWRRARAAVASNMGAGPQERISTSARSAGESELSHASARSVTVPSKQPGRSAVLARRLGMPHSSRRGIHAMTPVGMPGTTMTEGRGRKGKGVSEPSSTSGVQAVLESAEAARAASADATGAARICSAKNNVGPMPAPSPINSRRGLLATRSDDVREDGHAYGNPIAHLVADD